MSEITMSQTHLAAAVGDTTTFYVSDRAEVLSSCTSDMPRSLAP